LKLKESIEGEGEGVEIASNHGCLTKDIYQRKINFSYPLLNALWPERSYPNTTSQKRVESKSPLAQHKNLIEKITSLCGFNKMNQIHER